MDGKRLKKLREEKKLTQKELADMLDLTPKAISFYELGSREPSGEVLINMARILDTTTDYLLGCSDAKDKEIPARIQKDLNKFLEQTEIIFDGDTYNLTDDEKDMVKKSLEIAFFAAKRANKRKKDDPHEE